MQDKSENNTPAIRLTAKTARTLCEGTKQEIIFEYEVNSILEVIYNSVQRQVEFNLEPDVKKEDYFFHIEVDFKDLEKPVKTEIINRLLTDGYAVVMMMETDEEAEYVLDIEKLGIEDPFYQQASDDLYYSWNKFFIEF